MPAGTHKRTPGTQTRLPWWALALPTVAFVALFTLLAGPASAGTPSAQGGGSLGRVVELVQHSLGHRIP
ncbi:hypothetical protein [Streptomyces orinoci]|uniref:Uncharacterized protein n=1 Tax=Streptomyces orinoci TaxID=67339 RepID=A0ABV3JWR9_STRON|nr:hypothetical protein [Streptomyces orinoci]